MYSTVSLAYPPPQHPVLQNVGSNLFVVTHVAAVLRRRRSRRYILCISTRIININK